MRKLLILTLLSVFTLLPRLSQGQEFHKSALVFTPGFGAFNRFQHDDLGIGIPPVSLGLEYGIDDNMGLGGGLFLASANDDGPGWDASATYFAMEGRFYYHFNEVFKVDKLDWYGYAALGILYSNYDYEDHDDRWHSNRNDTDPYLSIMVGARYYFTDRLAGMAELGFGVSPLILGVALKL